LSVAGTRLPVWQRLGMQKKERRQNGNLGHKKREASRDLQLGGKIGVLWNVEPGNRTISANLPKSNLGNEGKETRCEYGGRGRGGGEVWKTKKRGQVSRIEREKGKETRGKSSFIR